MLNLSKNGQNKENIIILKQVNLFLKSTNIHMESKSLINLEQYFIKTFKEELASKISKVVFTITLNTILKLIIFMVLVKQLVLSTNLKLELD